MIPRLTPVALLLVGWMASAANYRFSVPELKAEVHVQPDASVRIVYHITFANSRSARPIDVVDIGTPHATYDLPNIRAWIDGKRLNEIRPSEYVSPGVEVHLGNEAIQPGEHGTIQVEFTMPDMVYQDTTRRDYASVQFVPTWFAEQFVEGTTLFSVAIFALEGISPEELLYQDRPFTDRVLYGGRAAAVWRWADRATGPHRVAVSFPKRGMERVITMTPLQLATKYLRDNPNVRIGLGIALIALFGFLFFRFSGNTGCSLFGLLSGGLIYMMVLSPMLHLLVFPPLIALILLNEWFLRRRRGKYLPPVAQVEGGGIKRGLTAPEAAVLLEMPLGKILGLVLFAMLKKGILRQVSADPLVVEVTEPYRWTARRDMPAQIRRVAQERGVVVHNYELPFLFLLEHAEGKPVNAIDFSGPMKALIQHAAGRVAGFDLSDTQTYYRRVIQRAVQEASTVGDVQRKEKTIDRYFEWLLLDEEYPTIFDFGGGRSYRPVWTRPVVVRGGTFSPAPSGAPADPAGGRTTLGDVMGSFAGWTENVMGSLASSISPQSLNLPKAGGGFVDLSGVDRVSADVFEALAKSSSGGRGGGFGGCACAGCACACACAGGGR